MYFLDISINIISLSGLVLGVGMMLDNSIVVLENIFIHNKDSNNIIDNIKASVNGASEVSIAITASTLTSVSVFLPFLFVKGQVEQMFSDLCLTVSISLLTSLFVAITIVPLLASRIKNNNFKFTKLESFFQNNIHSKTEKFYLTLLSLVMKNKRKSFLIIFSVLFSLLILMLIKIPKEKYSCA